MPFKDFNQVFEPLVLPINGKNYTIPTVGSLGGVRLLQATDPSTRDKVAPLLDDEYFDIVLGSARKELIADGVPAEAFQLAARTAFFDWRYGRAEAEALWDRGLNPKAPVTTSTTPSSETTTETPKTPSTPSPSTDAAKKTRSPASTNGTRSRKKS